ncbi:MAG: AMP-dependent synthetase/ligase [Terriglobales bacterium]|jgi:long-chain acyl-CoA synthetase
MGPFTLVDIVMAAIERDASCVAKHKASGAWTEISSKELHQAVVSLAGTLDSWGISSGERVAIFSENRPEWAITDFAAVSIGVVDVPIYATLIAEQAAVILKDSGARVLFLSTREQFEKFVSIQNAVTVEKVVVFDDVPIDDLQKKTNARVFSWKSLISGAPSGDAGERWRAKARSIQPDDLATLIYTSGTTGTPKGVMLTHGNIASNMSHSLALFNFVNGDIGISFLPLSHITARHLDYCLYLHGVVVAYCPHIEELPQALLEIQPTIIVAVPRVYEKVREKARSKASSGLKKRILDWAMNVGEANLQPVLAGKIPSNLSWKLANALVYSKIKAGFGGRGRFFISGGAPLGYDLARWYACMSIRIHEGYGLTETSPVIAINTPVNHRIGTVGMPLPNMECRIAEDGEILVRGPAVFHGYWQREQETRDAFADGWFKTGDIGGIDADGYLSITDRKKDLIKTSGGKFIAPQPIEGKLKANALVAEAAVLGDRRKFPSVLIAPQFSALETWAREHGIAFSDRRELIDRRQVKDLYEGIVHELNQGLAKFEQLKKVLLVPDEFTIATGEITPSMKLKRKVVEKKYAEQINAMYAEEPAPVMPA